MDWFKHSTDSHDDPDISDAMDEFGHAGYSIFFIVLELYGKEYNHLDSDGWVSLSRTFLKRKLRLSSTKVEQILNFYSERQRIIIKTTEKAILIKSPKFIDIASNWVKRKAPKPTEDLQSPTVAPTAKEVEVEVEKNKTFSPTSDEVRLSELLFQKISSRDPKNKKPNIQSWAKHIDRLIRIDNRGPTEIRAVIEWCQGDPFWQNNILSTEKLRSKFTQLALKMKDTINGNAPAGSGKAGYSGRPYQKRVEQRTALDDEIDREAAALNARLYKSDA
jgi:hypothetical protein